MGKRLRSKRKSRGGGPRDRDRARSPSRDRARSPSLSSRYRSRSRSRSRSSSRPRVYRVSLSRVSSDLVAGINWLLGKEDLPDLGPHLRFNIEPLEHFAAMSLTAAKSSLSIIRTIITMAISRTMRLLTSFEKVKLLFEISKYIILFLKIVVVYLPTEKLPGEKNSSYKPAPNDYEDVIDDFRQEISKVEDQIKELDQKFGRIHTSDLVSAKYQELTDTLTSLIEDMNRYIDENCSIVFGPPPPINNINRVNVNQLVRTISNPIEDNSRGRLKKKKKKKKKK